MQIRDPGWRQFGSGIRDGKKSDPGKTSRIRNTGCFTRKKIMNINKFIVKCETKNFLMKVIKYIILYLVPVPEP